MALFANGKYWVVIYLCLIIRETTREYEHKSIFLRKRLEDIQFNFNRLFFQSTTIHNKGILKFEFLQIQIFNKKKFFDVKRGQK